MASDDDAAAVPAAVEHTEGTSYVVPFGDPSSHPLPGSENFYCRPFPAAGGENPYQTEVRDGSVEQSSPDIWRNHAECT